MHELQVYDMENKPSYFLTLTYDDQKSVHSNNLHPDHLRNFWKILRKHGKHIRYFACGEYGDRNQRPHYHAIVFGLVLDDLQYHDHIRGNNIYTSETIQRYWVHGNVIIGNVTFESSAYVARYITKKRLGKNTDRNYKEVDHKTGEIIDDRFPEFVRMSQGIGKKWLEKFSNDVYKSSIDGTVIIRGGTRVKVPRYYDDKMEKVNSILIQGIKERRKQFAADKSESEASRKAREKEALVKEKLLKRSLT